MYDDVMEQTGSKKYDSLLVYILSSRKNTIKRAFQNSSRRMDPFQATIMKTLENEGLIREIEPGSYSLTAKGVMYVELELRQNSIDELTEWIDREYLCMDNEPIGDKNRVILLALFSARCFSEDTCASYSDERREKAFLELLENSYQFLHKRGLVKTDALESTKDAKSKSKISSILNQIDKLPSSTGMRFIASSKNYHLKVTSNEGIDRQSITFITKIILGDDISSQRALELREFCKEQYLKYGFLFKTGKTSFDGPIIEFQIKNGIDDAML